MFVARQTLTVAVNAGTDTSTVSTVYNLARFHSNVQAINGFLPAKGEPSTVYTDGDVDHFDRRCFPVESP